MLRSPHFLLSSFVSFVGICVFALRCHRVLTHTGNHASSSRFSPNPPMHANLRYFAPLPTHSDLCLSADRCTGLACILTYTVHHSLTLSRLSPPKTRHAWYASHTEPTVTRLGYAVSPTHVPRYAHRVTRPHRYPQPHPSSFSVR